VVARIRAGGIGLVARQRGPGSAVIGELVPGVAARVVVLDAGEARVVCSGPVVAAFDTVIAATLELVIDDGRAELRRDGISLVACAVDQPAGGERGAWGVAAVGAGAEVAIDTVTVAR
ncbi:MAG: hypothetical protein H0T89_07220, partial [Deltaproteobacteria bacterium]|nr:hypothetical protein [Deltaproteobacteria bacterium]